MAGGVPGYEGPPNYIYDIVDFVGELFFLGAAGGSAFHLGKGLCVSPSGARLAGAANAVRANVPRVAGTFGAYCVAFSAIEGAVSLARGGRERDMWSSTAAAAATWGLDCLRRGRGAPAATRCGLLGAVGFLVVKGIDHAGMVWQSRQADAEALLRQKRMMDRGQPTPVSIAASRTAPGVAGAGDHCSCFF
ncbi:unnamed protein product [Urochloa humidicola]